MEEAGVEDEIISCSVELWDPVLMSYPLLAGCAMHSPCPIHLMSWISQPRLWLWWSPLWLQFWVSEGRAAGFGAPCRPRKATPCSETLRCQKGMSPLGKIKSLRKKGNESPLIAAGGGLGRVSR